MSADTLTYLIIAGAAVATVVSYAAGTVLAWVKRLAGLTAPAPRGREIIGRFTPGPRPVPHDYVPVHTPQTRTSGPLRALVVAGRRLLAAARESR
ncbi:hypothetical protein AB0P17_15335 [Streptomyces sp. NPDC088124]|uniref:hypothetical protein n=1 Tax=Streptomyces sp. NPDC088124 TaxID=3154654 RepID=UPI003417C7E2